MREQNQSLLPTVYILLKTHSQIQHIYFLILTSTALHKEACTTTTTTTKEKWRNTSSGRKKE
jgi:uncharacterized membrane protein